MTPKQILAKNMGYSFACPECGAVEELYIHVTAFATVFQQPLVGTFDTALEGDAVDFIPSDFMSCPVCEHLGSVADFDLRN
jgi:hypothetical protein